MREIFEAAVDLCPEERAVYLDAVCGKDPRLRQEVEALILADRVPGHSIAGAIRDAASGLMKAGSSSTDLIPDRIGPYPILGKLGRGGMGVVYLAEDPRLERRIALKILPPDWADDSERRARFEREAKLLASINHPNIATIYSLEQDGDLHFLTMELVEGETLSDRMARDSLSVEDALRAARQVASALEAAHERGIIHRDLKPSNVMMRTDNRVKVLDFGIAKVIRTPLDTRDPDDARRDVKRSATETLGPSFGTPGYMSPEQLRGEDVDHRADAWGFGCILYECLAGKPLFAGETQRQRIEATLGLEPDWKALPAQTPDEVRGLLVRCLKRDPSERLRSMTDARRAVEEAIDALGRRAPPAPDRGDVPNNLPFQLSRFIGRTAAIPELMQLLTQHRLLTLSGPGGCGKTRLALEVAERVLDRYRDGAWLIQLARIRDPENVVQAAAAALEVTERTKRSLSESVLDFVRDRKLLLILDNCEHVLPAAARLIENVLRASGGAQVLATSRERLAIPGEIWYQVPPLSVPREDWRTTASLEETESVALFVDRARSVSPGFRLTAQDAEAVSQICRRLDGLPLAVELAAARVKTLSVQEISERLDDRFHLLTTHARTAVSQHRTLRATLDWSHALLTEPEQMLFRRLSIFTGGWSLSAAESISPGDAIPSWEFLDLHTRLVEKSLVERDETSPGRARYRMLETVREYARERLEVAGESRQMKRLHRDHFLALAEEARPRLVNRDQRTWLDRLQAEHENFATALATCAADVDGQPGLRLTFALSQYWLIRGHWTQGREACIRALSHPGGQARTKARAGCLAAAGALAYRQGDYDVARTCSEESAAVSRELNDAEALASAVNMLGTVETAVGNYAAAHRYHEENLIRIRKLGDDRRTAAVLTNLGLASYAAGDFPYARSCLEESLAIRKSIGDRPGIASSLHGLATLANERGELETAQRFHHESLSIRRELGDRRGIAASLQGLGISAFARGDVASARERFEADLYIRRELGDQEGIAAALNNLAMCACAVDDYAEARSRGAESLALHGDLHDRRGLASTSKTLVLAACGAGDHADARRHAGRAVAVASELGNPLSIASAIEACAVLAVETGNPTRGVRLLAAAEAMREEISAPRQYFERKLTDHALSAARRTLGQGRIPEEWTAGRAMTMEEAVTLAASRDSETA